MKLLHLMVAGCALLIIGSVCQAETVVRWDFSSNGDAEGWTVSPGERGVVMGGSLWLMLAPEEMDPNKLDKPLFQWEGDKRVSLADLERYEHPETGILTSPSDLNLRAADVTQVRMRVLNLSSLSDFLLRWRTEQHGWGGNEPIWGLPQQSRRCTLKPDTKEWQEITCYIDRRWKGTIRQLALSKSLQTTLRGSLWIDWIEIVKGDPEPPREQPDVASVHVVPKITIPGISQGGFSAAFAALSECLTTDVPIYGFNYPVMSPGGYWSAGGWWQLDSSLALIGAKWTNQHFAEDVIRGFSEVQDPDGRIDLAGYFWIRGQPADMSSLPKFLEVAYDVARRTNDVKLRERIYESMRRYLDWWLSPVKRDSSTGLISGVGEETFGDPWQAPHLKNDTTNIQPMTLAPVDTNVTVAVGAFLTARLADALGKRDDAEQYRGAFNSLSEAINRYMWDDETGAYYNYDLSGKKRRVALNVTIFDPLRLRIASVSQRDRLVKRLLDSTQFNWGHYPLTSWAMTEEAYIEAPGDYDGRAWFGNIWTLRNMTVVSGLEESDCPDLAAELNWATIKTFHSNYREYALPSSGRGQGAENYAWTASQYIGAVIEHLFGVDYDAVKGRLTITPHVPRELYGSTLVIEDLILPTRPETRLKVSINEFSPTAARVQVEVTGARPSGGELEISLPGGKDVRRTALRALSTAIFR